MMEKSSTYLEKFPTKPISLVINGIQTNNNSIGHFECNLDHFNKEELNLFYTKLDEAFTVTYAKRNVRMEAEQKDREYREYLRLKAKFETNG